MNITITINGEEIVLSLRDAKMLYHELNKILHGKELKVGK